MPEKDEYLQTKRRLAWCNIPLVILGIVVALNPREVGFAWIQSALAVVWLGWFFVWSFTKEDDPERTAKKRAFAYFLLGIVGLLFVSALAGSAAAVLVAFAASVVWDICFIIWGFSKQKV